MAKVSHERQRLFDVFFTGYNAGIHDHSRYRSWQIHPWKHIGSIVQKKATQLIFRVFPNQFFKSWNETGSCAGIEKRVSVITVLFNGVKNGGHMLTVFSILCIGAIAEHGNGRLET